MILGLTLDAVTVLTGLWAGYIVVRALFLLIIWLRQPHR